MKKILIVGAGFLQSFVIKKSKELGYYTLCVDGNPNAVGFKYADDYKVINITEKEDCLKYAKEMNIDGVITAATDYGVLTVSYIAEKLNLKGNNYIVAETIKNKYLTRRKLIENRVDNMSEYYEVDELSDIERLSLKVKYPVIVKPCDGSGSRGIKKVNRAEELKEACHDALINSLSKKALIEQFIVGKEYGVESFVSGGEIEILTIMEKVMTPPPIYAELGHCSKSGLKEVMEEKIKKIVKTAITVLGITSGSVNMDLLINNEDKIFIVDIGLRMGGNLIGSHIIPLSTGLDYMELILKESLGESIEIKKKTNKCIATRLLTLTPGKVKEIGNYKKISDSEGVKEIFLNLEVGKKINEYRSNLDGCGYLVVEGLSSIKAKGMALKYKEKIDEIIKRIEE